MSIEKILRCPCVKQGCWRDDRNKIPTYCEANIYLDELNRSNKEYSKKGILDIYKASCVVREHNDGMTPRIQEGILYAKELKLQKIGFAACIAMVSELDLLVRLFTKEGFEVYTACCQIGGIDATERGVPDVQGYSASWCHSIAQAKILNKERTELNFIVGLCMGHDILFCSYSDAPVSVLIVKDRVTGNNPAAALYGWHQRKQLFGVPLADIELL
jgi:uncharacterized metal-binding protein